MKVRVEEKKEAKKRLPEIGEVYRHETGSLSLMRIDQNEGARALNYEDQMDRFIFGVDLRSGKIYYSSKNCKDLQILEPVGGEIVFKVKEESN